jgi:hypothetical protein
MLEDTQTVFQTGLTKRYHPVQNTRAFEAALEMSQATGQVLYGAKAESFNHGSRSIVQVDMGAADLKDRPGQGNHTIDRENGDIVFRRLTFLNNHTGGGCVTLICTPYRGACSNGLAVITNSVLARISHTATAEQRIKLLVGAYARGEMAYKATEEVFRVMARTPVNKAKLAEYLESLFPSKDAKGNERDGKAAKNTEEAQEAVAAYFADADGGFTDRDTVWNAMNAATRYFTHDSKVRIHGEDRTEVRVHAARMDAMVTGSIAEKNALALRKAVQVFELDDDVARILAQVETSQAAQLATFAAPAFDIMNLGVGQE